MPEPTSDVSADTAGEAAGELVRLASADNFRDVAGAGAGYPTQDGGRVRRGRFYRAGELQLTDTDAAEVGRLGITHVHDLRTHEEVERHPDVPLPGASWHHIDVLGIPLEEIATLPDREAAVAMMQRVYRGFVQHEPSRAALGTLLRRLADDGVHLVHCSAGKDRTGWVAALLLEIAGVERQVIEADYLLSNEYAAGSRASALRLVAEHLGEHLTTVYEPVLLADRAYLHMAYDAVDTAYGSTDGYLSEGLGLDDQVRYRLRHRLRHRLGDRLGG